MEHRLQHPRFAVYVFFGALVLDCMGFKEKVKLHAPSFFHFLTCFDIFDSFHLLPIIIQDHTGTVPSKLRRFCRGSAQSSATGVSRVTCR